MLIRRPPDIRSAEITDEALYLSRREWLATVGLAAVAITPGHLAALGRRWQQGGDLKPSSYKDITTYNNFYEFGTGKGDPSRKRRARCGHGPGSVRGRGRRARSPARYDLDDLLEGAARSKSAIYRHALRRGMVDGDPLDRHPARATCSPSVEPSRQAPSTSSSTRCYDPQQMPRADAAASSPWPYVEGLRIDEAHAPAHAARRPGSTARRCPTRTAHRCGSWCRGSTASRASSRS
ncbi:MAG: hypothetical protein V9E87_14030 [Gemmatimonadales bacterium]